VKCDRLEKAVALATLLVVASAAAASDWLLVGQSAIGTLEFESTTIRHQGTHAIVWFREHYHAPQDGPNGTRYDLSMIQADIGCNDDTVTVLAGSYSLDGVPVSHFDKQADAAAIEPDSIMQAVEHAACRPTTSQQPAD
jgi:hypothetical protein